MNAGGAKFPLPSRKAAAWFEIRATRHRLKRFVRDLANRNLARIPRGETLADAPILAEHSSPLWQDGRPDEFPLVAGKVENLRLAIKGFQGIDVPPGQILSFWKQVGPPWQMRGFVEGREINQGCVIPAIAGGLCQLSNTIALAATHAGIALTERHAHTARIEQGAFPEIFTMDTFTNYSSSDYNGFRPNPGQANAFGWNSPPRDVVADFTRDREQRRYGSLRDYSTATGQDRHSVLVDYGDFVRVSAPDPANPRRFYRPDEFDFTLNARSRAVDAGVVLPNVNDGFTGKAPDLGAFERGRPLPSYGPRKEIR